eukprot:COSAG02_NODE_168_length_31711_cov_68.337973_29_plen_112_part_00
MVAWMGKFVQMQERVRISSVRHSKLQLQHSVIQLHRRGSFCPTSEVALLSRDLMWYFSCYCDILQRSFFCSLSERCCKRSTSSCRQKCLKFIKSWQRNNRKATVMVVTVRH